MISISDSLILIEIGPIDVIVSISDILSHAGTQIIILLSWNII